MNRRRCSAPRPLAGRGGIHREAVNAGEGGERLETQFSIWVRADGPPPLPSPRGGGDSTALSAGSLPTLEVEEVYISRVITGSPAPHVNPFSPKKFPFSTIC